MGKAVGRDLSASLVTAPRRRAPLAQESPRVDASRKAAQSHGPPTPGCKCAFGRIVAGEINPRHISMKTTRKTQYLLASPQSRSACAASMVKAQHPPEHERGPPYIQLLPRHRPDPPHAPEAAPGARVATKERRSPKRLRTAGRRRISITASISTISRRREVSISAPTIARQAGRLAVGLSA